ncbi:MAG: sugar phosphate isomerase/epimerase family protein [Pelolinea sp.]|nr:sugar phosphate isomerase/epimerase family protein [Pelolinea sp.]
MSSKPKFSANINTFNACADRYVLDGYGQRRNTDELIKAAQQVEDLTGVELVGKWHVNDDNVEQIHRQVKDAGFEVTCVTPDIWASSKWGWGSFTSNDEKIRKAAIHEVKKSMEWAKRLNCEVIDLWFGQDGYDYPLQADFPRAWELLIEGTIECAEHLPDVKIVVEYKPKEPRTHCFIATVGKTLLLLSKVNKPNVGAMIDVGHALQGYENTAESAALLHYFGDKLFYMHFNDNWRMWDDDMTFGSVHTIESLELIYWLDRLNYKGWYALDIFPYREDGVRAANESIKWIKGFNGILDKIGRDEIGKVVSDGDAMSMSALMRKAFLG